MKVEQAQIKKIGLGLVPFTGLVYVYFAFFLGPLEKTVQDSTTGIASLGPQIAGAKTQIAKTAGLETQGANATAYIANLRNAIPDGEPIAWFPPKLTKFFKDHGIETCSVRLVSEAADSQPDFRKLLWAVDLPKAESDKFGLAIAKLENDEPLLQIRNISIDANSQDPLHQHMTLIFTTLVKS